MDRREAMTIHKHYETCRIKQLCRMEARHTTPSSAVLRWIRPVCDAFGGHTNSMEIAPWKGLCNQHLIANLPETVTSGRQTGSILRFRTTAARHGVFPALPKSGNGDGGCGTNSAKISAVRPL